MGTHVWPDSRKQGFVARLHQPEPLPADADDGPRPISPEMSALEFCEAFVWTTYATSCHLSDTHLDGQRATLRLWCRFTGDPPLCAIDDQTISLFLAGLYNLPHNANLRKQQAAAEKQRRKFRKLEPKEVIAPATINTHCVRMQTVLRLAGPRNQDCKHGQRLLTDVPYIEHPTLDSGTERCEDSFTLDEMTAILAATVQMDWPRWPGIPAATWWQSLVIVAYNTSERRGALLRVPLPAPDADVIVFARWVRKGKKKTNVLPINAACRAAIDRVRTEGDVPGGRDLLFPIHGVGFPRCRRWFHTRWLELLEKSGIPESRRFGLHGLRREAATEMALLDASGAGLSGAGADAAQLLLHHSDGATTQRYKHRGRIESKRLQLLRARLDELPQPVLPDQGMLF